MFALFGTALGCVIVAGLALTRLNDSYAPYLLAGSGLYLVGVIGVTIAFNVPRNTALARIEASPGAPAAWTRYVAEWTAGNHVRAGAALAAAVNLTLALHGS